MNKLIKCSFIYAIAAMVGGVFYREFTKFNAFTGRTALGFVHTHLFILGMLVFLIAALFAKNTKLVELKSFKRFFVLQNIGVPLMTVMLVVRGITQVLGMELSKGATAAISGIAGISHIITGVAIVMLFLSLLQISKEKA